VITLFVDFFGLEEIFLKSKLHEMKNKFLRKNQIINNFFSGKYFEARIGQLLSFEVKELVNSLKFLWVFRGQ
jgi:hypothetical protein